MQLSWCGACKVMWQVQALFRHGKAGRDVSLAPCVVAGPWQSCAIRLGNARGPLCEEASLHASKPDAMEEASEDAERPYTYSFNDLREKRYL
jgi:hypothetical protein